MSDDVCRQCGTEGTGPLYRVELGESAWLLCHACFRDRVLTPRQAEFLLYLDQFRRERGYSPSIGDFCERFCCHKNSVHHVLSSLKTKGWVTWNENESRTLMPAIPAGA